MYIYFDIGANNGSDSIPLAINNKDYFIYAFEPTPYLCTKIKEQIKTLDNYKLIEKAVSNYNGKAEFKIAGNYDWGCSSLCNFNDNLNETWCGRKDFNVTDTITVDVIKLKDFIINNNIDCINYLHCDVQGHDLEVLMGLEDKISIVNEGVIEMPTSHNNKLYKDQNYIVEDAIKFLENNNFIITNIISNDCFNNEVNIYFKKK